jgi:hypothetical protein
MASIRCSLEHMQQRTYGIPHSFVSDSLPFFFFISEMTLRKTAQIRRFACVANVTVRKKFSKIPQMYVM